MLISLNDSLKNYLIIGGIFVGEDDIWGEGVPSTLCWRWRICLFATTLWFDEFFMIIGGIQWVTFTICTFWCFDCFFFEAELLLLILKYCWPPTTYLLSLLALRKLKWKPGAFCRWSKFVFSRYFISWMK